MYFYIRLIITYYICDKYFNTINIFWQKFKSSNNREQGLKKYNRY